MTETLSKTAQITSRDVHTEPAGESFRVARVAGWWRIDVTDERQTAATPKADAREIDSIPGYF
jgi:hypothetical protein